MTLSQFLIDLDWYRDRAGYALRAAEESRSMPAQPAQGATLLASAPITIAVPRRPERIIRRGGELMPYRPLDKYERLYAVFAKDAVTPPGALEFVEKFGPLTRHGLNQNEGDDVRNIIAHATQIGRLLDAFERGNKAEIERTLGPKGRELRGSPLSSIEVTLAFDPAEHAPKLQFTAPNLLMALWFQVGQSLASGTAVRRCQHCNVLFEVGPGAGRRLDAKFCSDNHRIEFNSRKRTSRENI
jgi:hypothetical protein